MRERRGEMGEKGKRKEKRVGRRERQKKGRKDINVRDEEKGNTFISSSAVL